MTKIFDLPLNDLLYFVEEGCHATLDDLLHELVELVDEFHLNIDEYDHVQKSFPSYLRSFVAEVHCHLRKEESQLFPLIAGGENRKAHEAIQSMITEHTKLKNHLERILSMVQEYAEVDGGVLERIYLKLQELEVSFVNLVHIEDDILFPMVIGKGSDH
jgi:iron-sulfur cluster repair protein YtfE (RIC family)